VHFYPLLSSESAGEISVDAEGSHLFKTGLWGKILLEKEKSESGVAEVL